jgi:hypothetical protein
MLLAASSFGAPIIAGLKPRQREAALVGLMAGLVMIAGAATVLFQALSPTAGRNILGATWVQAHSLVWAIGVQTAFLAVSTVGFLALRLVAPRSTLRPRLLSSAFLIPSFFLGFAMAGVSGAVWGLTFTTGVQALLAVVIYLRMRRRGHGVQALASFAGHPSRSAVSPNR